MMKEVSCILLPAIFTITFKFI